MDIDVELSRFFAVIGCLILRDLWTLSIHKQEE